MPFVHFWEQQPYNGQLVEVDRGDCKPTTLGRWNTEYGHLTMSDLTTENVRGCYSWAPFEGTLIPARAKKRRAKRQP